MSIDVKMGEVVISRDGECLATTGVGSCLVITLYNPKLKFGAMAHAMLARPDSVVIASEARQSSALTHDTKYVSDAIDAMLTKMQEAGSKNGDLEAKLVGGANMFPTFETGVSKNNIEEAKKKLKEKGLRIIGESTGGKIGRSVEFDPKSGIVTVSIRF